MRQSSVHFSCVYPGKRYRHEKPDLKVLLEKKEETYVDVSNATWHTILWVRVVPRQNMQISDTGTRYHSWSLWSGAENIQWGAVW